MVNAPIQQEKVSTKANCVADARFDEFQDSRQWLRAEPPKKKMPWDSGIFWLGISFSLSAVVAVLWLLVSGAQIAFNSNWVVKPATVNQLDDVQKTVKDLKERQERTDKRLEKITDALEAIAQNSAVTAEAAKRANETADRTNQKIDNLLIQNFVHSPPQAPSYKPPSRLRKPVVQPQVKTGQR